MRYPQHDARFRCMGTEMRLLVDEPKQARRARAYLENFDRRLSRFRPDSELCALNRDARWEIPASPLLREAVRAALWAARTTAGIVDPTLVGALEQAGYDRSLAGEPPASLALALAAAPPRRPARPAPTGLWQTVEVDDAAGVIRRPPGVALDIGGTGKGLAADAVAQGLSGRFVVDCGGDLRLSGPYEVEVEHPITRATAHTLLLDSGAIATSGLATRLWERRQGGYAHHLLDPSTGHPAWTGLLSVTACATTALEAETLAKAALLLGPAAARGLLGPRGGVLIHDSGEAELIGAAPHRRRIRLALKAAA